MVVFDYQKRFPRGAFLHLKGAFGACGITAVLGPSGSGKTTLARLLAGLAAPDAGRCVVNGPGEAADADIGVACGDGVGIVFSQGKTVRKVDEADIVDALMEEIGKL